MFPTAIVLRTIQKFKKSRLNFMADAPQKPKKHHLKERLENSYRLDPPVKFRPGKIEAMVLGIFKKYLAGKKFDYHFQPQLTKIISEEIKQKIKDLNFKRYKYVVTVTVGEKKNQGLRVASRCLWDNDHDDYVSVAYDDNKNMFAVATIYAVYYE